MSSMSFHRTQDDQVESGPVRLRRAVHDHALRELGPDLDGDRDDGNGRVVDETTRSALSLSDETQRSFSSSDGCCQSRLGRAALRRPGKSASSDVSR